MDFNFEIENINLIPYQGVLTDVDRISIIMAEEHSTFLKTIYNRYMKLYNKNNPEKRREIQRKYNETHPKNDIQRAISKEYQKAYYLKRKLEQNNIIFDESANI